MLIKCKWKRLACINRRSQRKVHSVVWIWCIDWMGTAKRNILIPIAARPSAYGPNSAVTPVQLSLCVFNGRLSLPNACVQFMRSRISWSRALRAYCDIALGDCLNHVHELCIQMRWPTTVSWFNWLQSAYICRLRVNLFKIIKQQWHKINDTFCTIYYVQFIHI